MKARFDHGGILDLRYRFLEVNRFFKQIVYIRKIPLDLD